MGISLRKERSGRVVQKNGGNEVGSLGRGRRYFQVEMARSGGDSCGIVEPEGKETNSTDPALSQRTFQWWQC